MAFKLDREQRQEAQDLFYYMCANDDEIERFAYELIFKRAEVERLRKVIRGAIAIKDLWMPSGSINQEHYSEAQALSTMLDKMNEALEDRNLKRQQEQKPCNTK